jgi:hypothetical protein
MEIENVLWQEGWTPTTDYEVTQLLKYLSDKQKETDRVVESAKEEIEMLSRISKDATDKQNRVADRINYLCSRYVLDEVDEDDRRETKTMIKYRLARGEIVINKAVKKIKKPTPENETILTSKYPQFIKQEPKFQWSDFKETIELDEDGNVIDKSTGQIVEGVQVVETPQTVSIKLNS